MADLPERIFNLFEILDIMTLEEKRYIDIAGYVISISSP